MESIDEVRRRAIEESRCGIDGIWVYGNRAQSMMTDFSQTVANTVFMCAGNDTELCLDDIIGKLGSSKLIDRKSLFGIKRRKGSKVYRDILSNIDRLVVEMRIRQAQLLKNTCMFGKMSELINECIRDLEVYIEIGEKSIENDEYHNHLERKNWNERMQRKLSELRDSHIIAMQSKAQVELLIRNNRALVDAIENAVNNTIPLWRNHVVMIYGFEQSAKPNNMIYGISRSGTISKQATGVLESMRGRKRSGDVDFQEQSDLNGRLENELVSINELDISTGASCETLNRLALNIRIAGREEMAAVE